MTDKEYYSDKTMLTNTMLGWIMAGPKYFKKQLSLIGLEKTDEESFLIFGNAVHCKLLEPNEFGNRYYVRRYDPPSNAVQKKFCSILISHKKKIDKKAKVMAYKLSYSAAKMSDEQIEAKANELFLNFKDHIIEQQSNPDKIELSKNDYTRILRISNNVKSHKRATELLSMRNSKSLFTRNEMVIQFEIFGHKMKSKLDKFVIDFDKKEITLIDIKTHSSKSEEIGLSKSFSKSFFIYNYDRQLYVYTLALTSFFIKEFGDKYNIDEFSMHQKIIAIRSNFENDVTVFNISEDILLSGEAKFMEAIKAYEFYDEKGYDYNVKCNEVYEEEIEI